MKAPSKGAAWIWGGLALAVNALSLGVALDASWWAPDDGYYANVAQRVLDGEVLHRDVQEIHPGAIVAINAAALRLFGTSLLALRMPLAAGCVVTGLVLSWIFRRRSPALGFLAALAPTLLGVLQFANPSAHWYSLFLFFVLVLCVVEVAPGSAGRVAALGVLLGLVLLLRQLSGVIVGVGLVAWLLLEERRPSISRPWIARSVLGLAWLGVAAYLVRVTDPTGFVLFGLAPLALLAWALAAVRIDDRAAARLLAVLVGGVVAPFLPWVLYHLVHGSMRAWWADTVLATTGLLHLEFMGRARLAEVSAAGWMALFSSAGPREAASAVFWALLPWAGVALGTGLLVLGRPGRVRSAEPHRDALPFLAAFHGLVALHQQIPVYLFFTLAPLLAGLLWLASSAGRFAKWGTAGAVAGLVGVGAALYAGQPIGRPFEDVLAGRRSALVDCGIARCGLRIPAEDRRMYSRLLEIIDEETVPGEAIFAFPCQPELYFLSGRRNPFRFWNSAVGIADRDDLAAVLERLRREPPRLVFHNPQDKYAIEASREIAAELASTYERLPDVGPLQVYRSRPAG